MSILPKMKIISTLRNLDFTIFFAEYIKKMVRIQMRCLDNYLNNMLFSFSASCFSFSGFCFANFCKFNCFHFTEG